MAQYIFKLPDIGEGTAEAELVAWHVVVGDVIEEDQLVADVMTDKATVELTSPVAGRVSSLHGEVGQMSQVGSPLIIFDAEASADEAGASATAAVVADGGEPASEAPGALVATPEPARASSPLASPAVRARAKGLGIPLTEVHGSGPHGRVRHADLDTWRAYRGAMVPAAKDAAAPMVGVAQAGDGWHEVKLSGLRRKIAEKMELSTRSIPHFSYVEEVDVTDLEQARAQLNARFGASRPKLSFLPFLIQALCRTLPAFPQINALYDEPAGIARYAASIHVGIAAQTANGLIVPVVADAQRLGLWDLAEEITRLAEAARNGTAKRAELSGSTITITSLGTLGGLATTPVINHPEVAIVGPNRIVERPVARGGEVVLRKMMNISSSFDHRIVDGHDAARFIQDLRALLEEPALLLAR